MKHLRGKFVDVSELETMIQLVPVPVDYDIVREVQQRNPAAAFKTKIGNDKLLDVIYDATNDYYLKYQGQLDTTQEERSLIQVQVYNVADFKIGDDVYKM